jgi:hypothetical protein
MRGRREDGKLCVSDEGWGHDKRFLFVQVDDHACLSIREMSSEARKLSSYTPFQATKPYPPARETAPARAPPAAPDMGAETIGCLTPTRRAKAQHQQTEKFGQGRKRIKRREGGHEGRGRAGLTHELEEGGSHGREMVSVSCSARSALSLSSLPTTSILVIQRLSPSAWIPERVSLLKT